MGFTPLEGVPMATRSGSVDPGALLYVLRAHGLSPEDVDHALNSESGLAGLAGGRDLRELEAAAPDDEDARLALRVYAYRIAKEVAGMGAALGGLDAIVFTAGVGEGSPGIRATVCERVSFLGVELDPDLNERSVPDADVAAQESDVRVLAIAAREELIAARAVRSLLERGT
jgi:acetate kinase